MIIGGEPPVPLYLVDEHLVPSVAREGVKRDVMSGTAIACDFTLLDSP
jgi:hypothetical protein